MEHVSKNLINTNLMISTIKMAMSNLSTQLIDETQLSIKKKNSNHTMQYCQCTI